MAKQGKYIVYPLIVLSVSSFLMFNHCSSSKSSSSSTPPLTITTGSVVVSCSTLGTGTENCSYQYSYAPSLCANKACRKLLISFAGDDMTCDSTVLSTYATDGYFAVCALLFQTSTAAGSYPYNQEAPRVNALVTTITADTTVTANWSGEYLFFGGTGHGATAPVVAMARTTDSTQPSWQGTTDTAACFLAGAYDMVALDGFSGANGCEVSTPGVVLPHGIVVGRYTGSVYTGGHDCGSGPCPCSPDHSSQADTDTLVGTISIGSFTITNWMLGACGDNLDPCTQEVVPAISISTLCDLFNSTGGYSCTYQDYPNTAYSSCSVSNCQSFFDAIVQ